MVVASMLVIAVGSTSFVVAQQAGGSAPPPAPTALSCGALASILLSEVHVTPRSLAAIDATNEQVRSIVLAARELCQGSVGTGASFPNAQRAVEQARERVQQLEAAIGAGSSTSTTRAELAEARAELQSAHSSLAAVRDHVLTAIKGVLSPSQRSTLATLRANLLSQPAVPLEYAAASASESELLAARDALAEHRRLMRIEPASQAAPSQPHGVPAPDGPAPQGIDPVIHAHALQVANRIRERLPSLRQEWDAALAD